MHYFHWHQRFVNKLIFSPYICNKKKKHPESKKNGVQDPLAGNWDCRLGHKENLIVSQQRVTSYLQEAAVWVISENISANFSSLLLSSVLIIILHTHVATIQNMHTSVWWFFIPNMPNHLSVFCSTVPIFIPLPLNLNTLHPDEGGEEMKVRMK